MVQNCTHHWMIETTQEATAAAVCRKCAAETTFMNGRSQSLTYGEEATLMFNPAKAKPRDVLPDIERFLKVKGDHGSRLRTL